ncbi:outer membrane beta-barrel domain-containing protein [bacterium]|nr:outer membrane beta-barrel domain-containing protein [bacterium]
MKLEKRKLLGLGFFILQAFAVWSGPALAAPPPAENEEYNFNWLDPDKKIYVLQNRKYTKANKVLLSGFIGTNVSAPFRTSYSFEPRFAYYFNEMFGIETFYALSTNAENSTFQALKTANPTSLPVVREIRAKYGIMLHYVPWYAKINVFNQVLYFDWYLAGGVGTVQAARDTRTSAAAASVYENENYFSFFWSTGHQYHLSRTFVVRLDFSGTYFTAPLYGTASQGLGNTLFADYNFAVGVGLRL